MPLTHLLRRLISSRLKNDKSTLMTSLISASAMKKLNARTEWQGCFVEEQLHPLPR
jgi:hypothetical protein